MSSQPSSTDTLLDQGSFYYFHFFLEKCLICIIAYLGMISRVMVAQMSNATTRKLDKMEIPSLGVPPDYVSEGLDVPERGEEALILSASYVSGGILFASCVSRAIVEERVLLQSQC